MKKLAAILVSLGFLLSWTAIPANANPNYMGVWYVLTWETNPRLIQVNKTTGVGTVIGTSTVAMPAGSAGFDVDATNGVGYVVEYTQTNPHIYSVNLATGQLTQGAATTAGGVTAFDIGNNGEIWIAADDLNGHNNGFGRINKETGAATFLADPPERIAALATSASGVLYAFDYSRNVYTVNTSTYAFTRLANQVPNSVFASDFDTDGQLITMGWGGDFASVNLTTAASTSLFTTDVTPAIAGESFGVGGPTNGQTLAEAIANPNGGLANTGSSSLPLTAGLLALVSGVGLVYFTRSKKVTE